MTDVQTTTSTKRRAKKKIDKPEKKRIPVTRYTLADEKQIVVLVDENPKSWNSPSWHRFNLYSKVKTVGGYRKQMRKDGHPHFANLDLGRDRDRKYIKFVDAD